MNNISDDNKKEAALDFKYSANPDKYETTITTGNRINPIADILFKIGAGILVLGTIIGLIIMFVLKDPLSSSYSPDLHPLRVVYGILIVFSGVMSGFLFIGLAEVIRQLTHIRETLLKN